MGRFGSLRTRSGQYENYTFPWFVKIDHGIQREGTYAQVLKRKRGYQLFSFVGHHANFRGSEVMRIS